MRDATMSTSIARLLRVVRSEPAGLIFQSAIACMFAAVVSTQAVAQLPSSGGDGFLFSPPRLMLTVRGGYDQPLGNGDVFQSALSQLTLSRGSLAAANYQIDIGVRLSDRLEVVATSGEAQRITRSEYRSFVDNNDLPIQQSTRLRRVPVSIGLKYALAPAGNRVSRLAWIPSRFIPTVGAGVGAMHHIFQQNGDFVDAPTLNVYRREFRSSGWTPMGYASVGAEVRLSPFISTTGDVRYTAARATPNGTVVGFRMIDLSGVAASLGFTFRR